MITVGQVTQLRAKDRGLRQTGDGIPGGKSVNGYMLTFGLGKDSNREKMRRVMPSLRRLN